MKQNMQRIIFFTILKLGNINFIKKSTFLNKNFLINYIIEFLNFNF